MSLTLNQLKINLRKEVKLRLAKMTPTMIQKQSYFITEQVLSCAKFQQSSRIGVYLSLPEEVATYDIVKHILNEGKECFIPRYNKLEMKLVKLNSIADLESLPETKWKIKQPSEREEREDAYLKGGLDYIIVPGLAFSRYGDRLGRGKGYYDKYLRGLKLFQEENNLLPLFAVGLAFTEQIVDNISTSELDFKLDGMFYPE